VSSTAAIVSAVHDDGGRQLPAMRSIKLVACNFCTMSSNFCYLDESLGRKSL